MQSLAIDYDSEGYNSSFSLELTSVKTLRDRRFLY